MELLIAIPGGFSPRATHRRLHRPLKSNIIDHLLHLLLYSLIASVIAVLLISWVLTPWIKHNILLILTSFCASTWSSLLDLLPGVGGGMVLRWGLWGQGGLLLLVASNDVLWMWGRWDIVFVVAGFGSALRFWSSVIACVPWREVWLQRLLRFSLFVEIRIDRLERLL